MSTAAHVAPDALALELANARAQFEALEQEWNEADNALGILADELKAMGQTIERLERQANGPAVPDYGAESGVI